MMSATKKNESVKNIRTGFVLFILVTIAFFFSFTTSSHAITITCPDEVSSSGTGTCTASDCSGAVSWGATGTGASINNGVLKTTSSSCGVITVAAGCSDGTTAIKQLRVANGGQWTIVASCNNEKMWQGLCGITNWQTCGNCQAWSGSAIIINEGNFQATQFISQITRTSGQNRYTTRWYAIYENGTGCNSLITECCPSYDSIAPIDHCCENVKECAAYPYSHTGPDACLFSQHERWVCSSCSDSDNDGYTTCNGDCDDGNAAIHPGAPEICGDLIDNNCDGKVDEGCGCGYTIPNLPPKIIGQCDPAWKSKPRYDLTSSSICSQGCAMASLTMLMNQQGCNVDMLSVNNCSQCFGTSGAIDWSKVLNVFCPNAKYLASKSKNVASYGKPHIPIPESLIREINEGLKNGYLYLLKVGSPNSPNGYRQHFVFVIGTTDDCKGLRVYDPATGREKVYYYYKGFRKFKGM